MPAWKLLLLGKSFIGVYELCIEFYSVVLTLEHMGHTDVWRVFGHMGVSKIWGQMDAP